MNIEMLVDGQPLVKIAVDLSVLAKILKNVGSASDPKDFRSTPATEEQMRLLLARIDERSVRFLKGIASSAEGAIPWTKMRDIFGIEREDDWVAYSGSFGKGITRAYRNILADKEARLVWWIEADWTDNEWDSEMCSVYVDGPALSALRAVIDG